jgi:catechol 2,3-dioxygenase-like lactoylglutathione lyase family enzyme
MPVHPAPPTSIPVIVVNVTDQDRALRFYTEVLGFTLIDDTPFGDGQRWVEVACEGFPTRISLAPPMEAQVGVPTGIGVGVTDIDAFHAAITERGADADPVQRMGDPVPPLCFFRDQDGNTLFATQDA